MKLSKIKEILKAQFLWGEELGEIEIKNACGADLMSDILADSKTDAVLLTGLTHRQLIQTAFMSEFAAVIFVRGKMPSEEVIELAKEKKMPLLRTFYPLFETCGMLYEAGLKGYQPGLVQEFTFQKEQEQEPLQTMSLSYNIQGNDFNNAGKATEQVKKILKQIGIDSAIMRKVSIAAYEAEMNIVIHAYNGVLLFNISPKYIEIIAEDNGPGIEDIDKAMQEGFSTASDRIRELGFGAGMGLPNMKKFSDTFEITSVVGKGTKVRMLIRL